MKVRIKNKQHNLFRTGVYSMTVQFMEIINNELDIIEYTPIERVEVDTPVVLFSRTEEAPSLIIEENPFDMTEDHLVVLQFTGESYNDYLDRVGDGTKIMPALLTTESNESGVQKYKIIWKPQGQLLKEGLL